MLPYALQSVGAACRLGPADDPAATAAPDDGPVAPQQFPDQCTGQVDVAMHLNAEHSFDRYVSQQFIAVLHGEPSFRDRGTGAVTGQMHDLAVGSRRYDPPPDLGQSSFLGQANRGVGAAHALRAVLQRLWSCFRADDATRFFNEFLGRYE